MNFEDVKVVKVKYQDYLL